MKQGRNEKCKCGSGLKYKNCCMVKHNTHTPKHVANEESFIKNILETSKMWQSDGGLLRIYKDKNEVEVLRVGDGDMMKANLHCISMLGFKIFVRDEKTDEKKYIPSVGEKIIESADDNTILCSELVAEKGSTMRMSMKNTLLSTIKTNLPFMMAVTESLMNEVELPKSTNVEFSGHYRFNEKVYFINNNLEKLQK